MQLDYVLSSIHPLTSKLPFNSIKLRASIIHLLVRVDRLYLRPVFTFRHNMPQMPVQQIIQDRYIDRNRLQAFLARKFAPGTYSVVVREIYPSILGA